MSVVQEAQFFGDATITNNRLSALFRFSSVGTYNASNVRTAYDMTKFAAALRVSTWKITYDLTDHRSIEANKTFPFRTLPKYVLIDYGYLYSIQLSSDPAYFNRNNYGSYVMFNTTNNYYTYKPSVYDFLSSKDYLEMRNQNAYHRFVLLPLRMLSKSDNLVNFTFKIPMWLSEKFNDLIENVSFANASFLTFEVLPEEFDHLLYFPSFPFVTYSGNSAVDYIQSLSMRTVLTSDATESSTLLSTFRSVTGMAGRAASEKWYSWRYFISPFVDQANFIPDPISAF